MSDVFARIRAAVQGTPSSDEIRGVIHETKDALAERQRMRAEHEATAANPLIDSSEAHRAQESIVRSHLDERRLAEGLKLLEPRLAETAEAERQANLVDLYDAARAKRDDLLQRFRKDYPRHAKAIVGFLTEVRDLDAVLAGIVAPTGRPGLDAASTVLSADRNEGILDAVLPLVTLCAADTWNTAAERTDARLAREQRERTALAAAYAVPPRFPAARAG